MPFPPSFLPLLAWHGEYKELAFELRSTQHPSHHQQIFFFARHMLSREHFLFFFLIRKSPSRFRSKRGRCVVYSSAVRLSLYYHVHAAYAALLLTAKREKDICCNEGNFTSMSPRVQNIVAKSFSIICQAHALIPIILARKKAAVLFRPDFSPGAFFALFSIHEKAAL